MSNRPSAAAKSELPSAPAHIQSRSALRAQQLAIWLGAVLLYAALAIAITWPLVPRLFSHIMLGTLPEPTVPYFNLWTLEWNVDRLRHAYREYWDAPLFYPAQDAFALSEPQGLTALLFAPLAGLAGPIAAYNLTLLSLLVMNACAGRRLLRVLGVAHSAATLGGALLVGLPLVCHELGVLQLCAAWPVLLGLSEIAVLAQAAQPWALARLAFWLVATAWSCIYYALFFGVFVLVAAALLMRRELLTGRMLLAGMLALTVVGVGVSPLLAAERRAVSGYSRSAETIRSGSGSALAYLQFPQATPLARLFPRWARPGSRRSLYPGAVSCALAALGCLRSRRSQLRRWLSFSAACVALALWFSFGTRLHVGAFQPYAFTAQRFLPGFGQLRSPYRAALFVHVLVIAWAGVGLDALARQCARSRWRGLRAAPALCVALALIEVVPWNIRSARFPHEVLVEPWIAWLAAQPAGPVAMLPPNAAGRASDYVDTTLGMLQGLRHGHPLANGYSGFFPPAVDRLMTLLRQFPSPASLRALRRSGVRYAVVDRRWPPARGLAERPASGLRRVFDTGRRSVYLLDPE